MCYAAGMSDAVRAYLALPPLDKGLFALVLVLHRPASRSDLTRVLNACGARDASGKPFTPASLLPFLERWQRDGLAQAQGTAWSADPRSQHALLDALEEGGSLAEVVRLVRRVEPLPAWGDLKAVTRELFLSLYVEPEAGFDTAFAGIRQRPDLYPAILVGAYGWHVPPKRLERVGAELAGAYLGEVLRRAIEDLVPASAELLAYAERAGLPSPLRASLSQYFAMRGEVERAQACLDEQSPETLAAAAFVALTRGELNAARQRAREAMERTRTKSSKRIKGLLHPLWPWLTLLLITDQADTVASALGFEQLSLCNKKFRTEHELIEALAAIHLQLTAPDPHSALLLHYGASHVGTWIEVIFYAVAMQLTSTTPHGDTFAQLRSELQARARELGFAWVASTLKRGMTLVQEEAPWQRALRALEQAAERATVADAPHKEERLVWVLLVERGKPTLVPRLQTRKGSAFSSGRAVSLRRLFKPKPDEALLDAHDLRVSKHIVELRDPHGWGAAVLDFDAQAALALVGHPRVFADTECTEPLTVERGEPNVQVHSNAEQGWVVQVHPSGSTERDVYAERVSSDRVLVYVLTPQQRSVVELLPAQGLALPAEARESVQRTLGKLAALFPMSSSLQLDAAHMVEVEADPRVHVQLRRLPNGLRMTLSVAPLGDATRLVPGEGNAVSVGKRGDETVRCTRDLRREQRELDALREALAIDDALVVAIPTLLDSLEVVNTLRALGERVVVEWPDGDPLSVSATRDVQHLTLRVNSEQGWLEAQGELVVDEALTLSFHDLLARSQPRHGRFIQLDDGRFVALSTALQRSIENLEALARVDAERTRLHPLALLALGQLDQVSMTGELQDRLARARASTTLQPDVPATFEATLRPYQVEGFTFLARLAHWQAGACLADDMGLGKTLQTLALLVERAQGGPALVVAPTSVCANWQDEARKFAPTLRVRTMGSSLDELGPYDVLVCSYGMLQQRRERLSELVFHTAVLDEAQAIKNAQTLRARAAFSIRADHRIALTGTPIENHLGELWSILHFLNPGMLGSEREFEQRFARPIQRDGDRARAHQLRRLTSPFVLRRKKSEVLDDLPEKTVITLRIEPSAEERALYRALREQALIRIQESKQPAQARIQLFAELTRLRRAACHPALVVPDQALPSSKLAALEELVEELRSGGHRALLFSQFVDHLTLVRTRFEELGIRYQYLDGSSSTSARAAATRDFQRGEGDVFLISLKAGGFGLNLTAADYVIHLDPWWNPAVEDQASDRAHRIGQTRPVTIYRLVMQDSIEEKILALHGSKRELADSVLAGEGREALNVDQLLELLSESHAAQG